jgi:HEAT repeat protein
LAAVLAGCSSLPVAGVGPLRGALRDFRSPEPAKRELAGTTLRRMGEDAVPSLREIVNSGTEDERYRAVRLLGRIGPQAADAVPDLIALLTGKDLAIPSAIAAALAGIGRPAEAPVLNLLVSGDEMLRYWAVAALGRMTDPSDAAIEGLIRMVADPVDVVAAAADIFLVTQGRRAIRQLEAARERSGDDDAGIRLAGILLRIRNAEPDPDGSESPER